MRRKAPNGFEGIAHLAALKKRCAELRFVCVGDRESDLYELFAAERPTGVDWLIRMAVNRRARHSEGYPWEAVQATAPLGRTELLVPARHHLPQHTAGLTLCCATVRLRPPRGRARGLPEVDVFAIQAIEDAPADGVEPIEWMLLSSLATNTLDDILERLAWYARRWTLNRGTAC